MRILHVLTTLDVGGAEMHVLAQVRGAAERGHDVRVAYLKGAGSLAEEFRSAGAREIVAAGSGPSAPARLWPHLRWAEIVHSHLLKADMLTALLATLSGRRRGLVASKHNDEQVLKRLPVGLVHGALGRLPRRTIVLSDHVGRFVAEHGRLPASRLTRIYYGLEPAPFENASGALGSTDAQRAAGRASARAEFGFGADDIVFVCVARFAAQKAHDVLLRAFADARTQAPEDARELRLLLVGGDPFGDGVERAEALAAELQLGDAVCFAGIRRDVARLYALSDVFVMSSLWEGLGLVFLEAMAAGLPVLSTRVSAIPEVVDEDVSGILVPPGESGPLGQAMGRLAEDPELRERLGAAGRARVRDRFALDRMVEETLEVYRGLLGLPPEAV